VVTTLLKTTHNRPDQKRESAVTVHLARVRAEVAGHTDADDTKPRSSRADVAGRLQKGRNLGLGMGGVGSPTPEKKSMVLF
jgi:hypothetical protein